jgi:hypothetical protein
MIARAERAELSEAEWQAYLAMGREEIARIILWLLIEETLRRQLAWLRPENLPPQPIER